MQNYYVKIKLKDKEIEVSSDNKLEIANTLYNSFMQIFDIDLKDPNSKDTPARVVRMFLEKTEGLRSKPPEVTTFPSEGYDEYICIKDIPYYSICSHHHVPFFGKVHICYWPEDKLAGLSKFARVVTYFANKPQIQESFTAEIADYLFEILKPRGLLVKVTGEHMCISSRGAKAVGSTTVTQQLKGEIDKDEALNMINKE